MVDRYAKFATEHLAVAASRIDGAVDETWCRFPYVFSTFRKEKGQLVASPLNFGRSWRIRTADQRIKSPLLYQLS